MKKILGFYRKIKWIKGGDNSKHDAQEEKISKLIREHEKANPDDSVWSVVSHIGQHVFAQPRSEVKPMTILEYDRYCRSKNMFPWDVPEGHFVHHGCGGYSLQRKYQRG